MSSKNTTTNDDGEQPQQVTKSRKEAADSDVEMESQQEPADLSQQETTTGSRRLIISKMVLENFKSYGGRVEIGPFHHCFSSVVGPNGSGKSNVIDAMLFVFGKRAKQLRLNKIRELIHKSDGCTPTSATVTVHMQEIVDLPPVDHNKNTNDADPETQGLLLEAGRNLPYRIIPNTDVVLSRTAKSDNTSVYKLNGKNSQFRDIANFLKTKGIDLEHNRFLILQGEVELISMMPPKAKNDGDNDGLLEYLEDIIGSHTFVPATLEAAEKVEALSVTRQEKLNRVKAAEQETKALDSAKTEAQALLRRERDIRQQQNILYQVERLGVQRKAAALHEKRQALQEELRKCRNESNDAAKELEEMKHQHKKTLRDHEKVHDLLQKTEQDFTAYERRDIKLRETIKHTKQKIKDLEKKVQDCVKNEQASQEKHDKALERIPTLEQKIEELKEKKVEEDTAFETLQAQTHKETLRLRSQLEVQNKALTPLLQDRAECQAALETAQTELNLVQETTKEVHMRLQNATAELGNLDATQRAKRDEFQRQQVALQQANDQVQAWEQEERNLATEEGTLSQKSNTLMARAEEAKAAQQSKSAHRPNPAVLGILKAAKQGGPLAKVGILGRLGDLATIEAKYDVAVSTACGCLDYVVVQTTAGAQRCLDFLRQHNLGRASFMPLDKLKKGAHDRVVDTPEGATRLLELIQPIANHNYTGIMSAFHQAVGQTLVAPDLETATRWAYDEKKRWRVVTLDGKLLETSGTMQGGGKEVSKGKMKLRDARASALTEEEDDGSLDVAVKELEQEVEQTQKRLQEIRKRRKEISDEIRQVKRQIKDLERSLPKLQMDLESFDTTRENLTQLIPQLQEQAKTSAVDKQKVKALTEKVMKCEADMKESIAQASELEAEVSRLQKAILNAGGTGFKKQQNKCEKIVQQLKEAEKELSSSKVAIKSCEKAINKAREAKVQADRQMGEANAFLDERQTEFKSLEDNAFAVKEAYDKAKEAAAAAKADLEEIEESSEKLKLAHAGLQSRQVELGGQLDTVAKNLAECEQRVQQYDAAIKKLLKIAKKDERELWADEPIPQNQKNNDSGMDGEGEEQKDEDVDMADAGDNIAQEEDQKEEEVDEEEQRLAASYPTYSEAALDRYDTENLKELIAVFETERNTLAKNANLGAIAEYRKKEAEYLARVDELNDVTEQRSNVRREYEELRRRRLEMFMEGFSQITLKLKEMYQMITLGGDAELELVDSLDPFSEGIVFSVRPPKKSWKNISNLSGGEKTLSSLALVFALHHYKPTPLYVMDEIDAALDYKNVSIVANYIRDRTKDAQFIIISLRNNMFELCDRMVGVYKTFNRSKSLPTNPAAYGVLSQQDGRSMTPALRNRSNASRASSTGGEQQSKRFSRSNTHAFAATTALPSPTPMAPMET